MADALVAKPAAGPQPERVVTLVHGTFAQHAPWLREGPLFDALQGLPETVISRFCWSGANSHTERLRAGEGLSRHLRGLSGQFPDARHFVVGHSHGGNVILYAMKDEAVSDRVAGLVTLATPFLSVRRRKLDALVLFGVWIICLLGLMEAVLYFRAQDAKQDGMSLAIISLTLIWTVGIALSAITYRGRAFGFREMLALLMRGADADDIVARELGRMKLVPDDPASQERQFERMLVARPFGDEATMSLVVSQFLGWAQNRILTMASGMVRDFWKVGWFSWIGKLLILVVMAFLARSVLPQVTTHLQEIAEPPLKALASGVGFGDKDYWVSGFIVVLGTLTSAILILFGSLALVCVVALMAAALPFGPDAMIWNLYASITAEASPPGSARVFLQSPPPEMAKPGLAHSGIYTDAEVIREVVEWIRHRDTKVSNTGSHGD